MGILALGAPGVPGGILWIRLLWPQELLDVYLAPLSKAGLPPLSLQEGEEVPKTMGLIMGLLVGWLGTPCWT